jgi:hypothetical protein
MNEDNSRRNHNRCNDEEFDPRVADFVTALDDFAEAAWALDKAWEIASESVDDAADGYPFPNSFEEVAYSIWIWSREAIEKLTTRPERAEEEGRAGSEPATRGGADTLTLEDIERLPSDEFEALPEGLRRRYFDSMDRENFPSPAEFYGDWDPERDGDSSPAEAFDDEKWTADAESCESHVMPEPTPEARPNEPTSRPEPGDVADLFGEVLFRYTRRQAIEDGVLVDVTETAREAGFKIPVALTAAVWAEYVEVPEGVEGQDEAGRLWDILWMARYGVARGKNRDASEVHFPLHVRNDNRDGEPPRVTLKAVWGPDDDGTPCLTVMLPDED